MVLLESNYMGLPNHSLAYFVFAHILKQSFFHLTREEELLEQPAIDEDQSSNEDDEEQQADESEVDSEDDIDIAID